MKSSVAALAVAASLLVLPGCATQQALQRATTYEQQGRFRLAYEQCALAKRLDPESPEADACVRRTRPHAIDQALAEAHAAFEAGDFPATIDQLDYVDQVSPEPVAEARKLRADVFATLAADTKKARADGEYARALDILEVWAKVAPDEAGAREVDHRKQQVRQDWYDSLIERARQFEQAGHPGAALVMYLSADHVSEHAVARTQARRLADALREQNLYRVHFSVAGPDLPAKAFDKLAQQALTDTADTRRVASSDKADLDFDAKLENVGCTKERLGDEVLSKEYVAGTFEAANPNYATFAQRLDELQVDVKKARRAARRRQKTYDERKADLQAHRDQVLVPLAQRIEQVGKALERAQADADASRKLADDARAQLERLEQEDASPAAIDAQRDTVDKLTQRAQADQEHLDKAIDVRDQLVAVQQKQLQREDRLEAKLDEAEAQLEEARDELDATTAKRDQLARRLEDTPQTVVREVMKTFRFKATTWEKRCSIGLIVRGDDGFSLALQLGRATRDKTHRAFAKYGVQKDPLAFEETDTEMLGELEATLADRLAAKVDARRATYFDTRMQRASRAMVDDPHTATDLWLATFLTAPHQLDQAQVDALAEHLQTQYGSSPMQTLSEL